MDNLPSASLRITSFTGLINSQEYGALAHDLDEKMRTLLLAVTETGKPGSITVTITATPRKDLSGTPVNLNAKDSVKLPKLPRPSTILYVLEDGTASPHHPKQMQMFEQRRPQVVPTPGSITDVDTETGEIIQPAPQRAAY